MGKNNFKLIKTAKRFTFIIQSVVMMREKTEE